VAHEVESEPVEQLGMRGSLATQAEVARAGHESFAKMPLPDAVHDDSGGERIFRIGDPLREFEPAAAFLRLHRQKLAAKDVGKLARHLGTGMIRLASSFAGAH
jgi:hypothetical protein